MLPEESIKCISDDGLKRVLKNLGHQYSFPRRILIRNMKYITSGLDTKYVLGMLLRGDLENICIKYNIEFKQYSKNELIDRMTVFFDGRPIFQNLVHDIQEWTPRAWSPISKRSVGEGLWYYLLNKGYCFSYDGLLGNNDLLVKEKDVIIPILLRDRILSNVDLNYIEDDLEKYLLRHYFAILVVHGYAEYEQKDRFLRSIVTPEIENICALVVKGLYVL